TDVHRQNLEKCGKKAVPKLNVLIQEMNPGYGLESDEIHHEADADELQIHSMLQGAGAGQAE
ncbi:MAG: hypothetical protein VX059_05700, partial [SAR324 cluster bacterium]|nr:hypothetical protein [SAR324 cluster bacterium]